MPRHIHCLLIVLLLAALSDSAQAAESEVTARSIFALLPESIFENTPEGLSPQEKQKLLSAGHSEFWEIAGETEDVLVFASMPFRDTAVGPAPVPATLRTAPYLPHSALWAARCAPLSCGGLTPLAAPYLWTPRKNRT